MHGVLWYLFGAIHPSPMLILLTYCFSWDILSRTYAHARMIYTPRLRNLERIRNTNGKTPSNHFCFVCFQSVSIFLEISYCNQFQHVPALSHRNANKGLPRWPTFWPLPAAPLLFLLLLCLKLKLSLRLESFQKRLFACATILAILSSLAHITKVPLDISINLER